MNIHFLVNIFVALLVGGFVFWLSSFIPNEGPFKQIAKGLIIFVVVLYVIFAVLSLFRLL